MECNCPNCIVLGPGISDTPELSDAQKENLKEMEQEATIVLFQHLRSALAKSEARVGGLVELSARAVAGAESAIVQRDEAREDMKAVCAEEKLWREQMQNDHESELAELRERLERIGGLKRFLLQSPEDRPHRMTEYIYAYDLDAAINGKVGGE